MAYTTIPFCEFLRKKHLFREIETLLRLKNANEALMAARRNVF